jgi:hypothetical protein
VVKLGPKARAGMGLSSAPWRLTYTGVEEGSRRPVWVP